MHYGPVYPSVGGIIPDRWKHILIHGSMDASAVFVISVSRFLGLPGVYFVFYYFIILFCVLCIMYFVLYFYYFIIFHISYFLL